MKTSPKLKTYIVVAAAAVTVVGSAYFLYSKSKKKSEHQGKLKKELAKEANLETKIELATSTNVPVSVILDNSPKKVVPSAPIAEKTSQAVQKSGTTDETAGDKDSQAVQKSGTTDETAGDKDSLNDEHTLETITSVEASTKAAKVKTKVITNSTSIAEGHRTLGGMTSSVSPVASTTTTHATTPAISYNHAAVDSEKMSLEVEPKHSAGSIASAHEGMGMVAANIITDSALIVPIIEDTTPAVDDATPAVEDATPAVDDDVPAVDDATPAVDDATPAVDDGVPAVDDGVPAVDDDVPAIDDAASVEHHLRMTRADSVLLAHSRLDAAGDKNEENHAVEAAVIEDALKSRHNDHKVLVLTPEEDLIIHGAPPPMKLKRADSFELAHSRLDADVDHTANHEVKAEIVEYAKKDRKRGANVLVITPEEESLIRSGDEKKEATPELTTTTEDSSKKQPDVPVSASGEVGKKKKKKNNNRRKNNNKKKDKTPASADGKPPLAADGKPPLAADGKPPLASDGKPPLAADGKPPLAAPKKTDVKKKKETYKKRREKVKAEMNEGGANSGENKPKRKGRSRSRSRSKSRKKRAAAEAKAKAAGGKPADSKTKPADTKTE